MDYFQTKRIMDMYGFSLESGMPMPIFPRFPPGMSPPTSSILDQKRLKEKFFQDNESMNTKLQDFNQMYQKFAAGLFQMAYPSLPPGHPLFSRFDSTAALQNENDKLRKENSELKKHLEKNQKTKSKI